MTPTQEKWIKFWDQQAIVRKMIISGDGNSEQFWIEHEKMIKLQLDATDYSRRHTWEDSVEGHSEEPPKSQ